MFVAICQKKSLQGLYKKITWLSCPVHTSFVMISLKVFRVNYLLKVVKNFLLLFVHDKLWKHVLEISQEIIHFLIIFLPIWPGVDLMKLFFFGNTKFFCFLLLKLENEEKQSLIGLAPGSTPHLCTLKLFRCFCCTTI